jgi:plastocyanin
MIAKQYIWSFGIMFCMAFFGSAAVTAIVAATPIASGETTIGDLSLPGQVDQYSFYGGSGDTVIIRMDMSFWPQIVLQAPNGAVVASAYGDDSTEIVFKLSQTGVYYISCSRHEPLYGGAYSMSLIKNPGSVTSEEDPEGGPIESGQTKTGSIAPSADLDVYTFFAGAGDIVTVRMDMGFWPRIYLQAPDGTIVASTYGDDSAAITAFTVDQTGTYFIICAAHEPGYAGNYGVSLTLIPGPGVQCEDGGYNICIWNSRFFVEVDWSTLSGNSGKATAVPLTSDSGYFWFFENSNVELLVKIKDGCAVNDHFWFFWGAMTDVQYTINVVDMETGAVKRIEGQQGIQQSGNDILAFACTP